MDLPQLNSCRKKPTLPRSAMAEVENIKQLLNKLAARRPQRGHVGWEFPSILEMFVVYFMEHIDFFEDLHFCRYSKSAVHQVTRVLFSPSASGARWISNCSIAKNKPRSRSGNWQYDMTAPHIFAHVYKCLHIVMVFNGKYNYKLYILYIYICIHTHTIMWPLYSIIVMFTTYRHIRMKIHSRTCSRHETELAEWQLRCRALEAEKRQERRREGIREVSRGPPEWVSWDWDIRIYDMI